MHTNFQFSNLCGVVYKRGPVLFTPDGNSLISPIGGRVSVFDLVNNISYTMPFELPKDIRNMALSPDGGLLLVVADKGEAFLINFHRRVVLSQHHFKGRPYAIQFSPNGRYFAITFDNAIQVWKTPPLYKKYQPYFLVITRRAHTHNTTALNWSSDSTRLICGSVDCSCSVIILDPNMETKAIREEQLQQEGKRMTYKLGGVHKRTIVNCFFGKEGKAYTISKDGAIAVWKFDGEEWSLETKKLLPSTQISVAKINSSETMMIIGSTSGFFMSLELPSLNKLFELNISKYKLTALDINNTGEWIALGVARAGQLLVWEWQSERYIMKQQGHYYDMRCLAYGPQGRFIATGGEDSKLKIWKTDDGFCFVTFQDHTATITSIEFSPKKQVVFTSSMDGTVRAYDLIRYRNFRIFTAPEPRQFSCVSVDPSGEIVAAGCTDHFEIYLWSLQTGNLLDVLEGHEGPVNSLVFSPTHPILASGSWDGTVKLWDVFAGNKVHKESFEHAGDVLAVAYRPDGKELISSSINGNLVIWDPLNNLQIGIIDAIKDVSPGRALGSLRTAKSQSKTAFFTCLSYTTDGQCVIAAGQSRFVCIYNIPNRILLRRFQICHNLSMDGVTDKLNSRLNTVAGPVELIDDQDSEDDMDVEKFDISKKKTLPGVEGGEFGNPHARKVIRVTDVKISPTGRQWACCTGEGLLVYSLDTYGQVQFDPYQLDLDITTKSVYETLQTCQYLKALVMSLRLNEDSITSRVFESIPFHLVKLLSSEIHENYIMRLMAFISRYMSPVGSPTTPHIHYCLHWVHCLFNSHGQYMKQNSTSMVTALRSLQKTFIKIQEDLDGVCSSNQAMLSFLCGMKKQRDLMQGNESINDNKTQKVTNQNKKQEDKENGEEEETLMDTVLPGWY